MLTDKMLRALRIVERMHHLEQDDIALRVIYEVVAANRAAQCNRVRTTSASTAQASA